MKAEHNSSEEGGASVIAGSSLLVVMDRPRDFFIPLRRAAVAPGKSIRARVVLAAFIVKVLCFYSVLEQHSRLL